jgi:hypothetical protein
MEICLIFIIEIVFLFPVEILVGIALDPVQHLYVPPCIDRRLKTAHPKISLIVLNDLGLLAIENAILPPGNIQDRPH